MQILNLALALCTISAAVAHPSLHIHARRHDHHDSIIQGVHHTHNHSQHNHTHSALVHTHTTSTRTEHHTHLHTKHNHNSNQHHTKSHQHDHKPSSSSLTSTPSSTFNSTSHTTDVPRIPKHPRIQARGTKSKAMVTAVTSTFHIVNKATTHALGKAQSTTTFVITRASSSSSPSATELQSLWGQCGGSSYTGPTACVASATCSTNGPWWAACAPATASGSPSTSIVPSTMMTSSKVATSPSSFTTSTATIKTKSVKSKTTKTKKMQTTAAAAAIAEAAGGDELADTTMTLSF